MRVSQLRDVLAVPTAALVSPREAAQIATAIGIDPETVREVLRSARRDGRRGGERSRSEDSSVSAAQGVVATSAPDASGKPSAPQDEARSGGRFVSFVMRDGVTQPIAVLAGASDLDFSEIRSGLEEGESVLMVPSAGLLDAQQQQRERMNRMMGGMPGTGRPPGGGGGGGGRPGR
jgi:hypothetical protein